MSNNQINKEIDNGNFELTTHISKNRLKDVIKFFNKHDYVVKYKFWHLMNTNSHIDITISWLISYSEYNKKMAIWD